jgi:hypothetical protein
MLFLLYGVAASQAIWSFANKWTTIMDHPQYSLAMTLAGEAPKPYANRLLMPAAVGFIAQHIPPRLAAMIEERAMRTLKRAMDDGAEINRGDGDALWDRDIFPGIRCGSSLVPRQRDTA